MTENIDGLLPQLSGLDVIGMVKKTPTVTYRYSGRPLDVMAIELIGLVNSLIALAGPVDLAAIALDFIGRQRPHMDLPWAGFLEDH